MRTFELANDRIQARFIVTEMGAYQQYLARSGGSGLW